MGRFEASCPRGAHRRLLSIANEVVQLIGVTPHRPCGLMDKALVFGNKDCRFESCQGHLPPCSSKCKCTATRRQPLALPTSFAPSSPSGRCSRCPSRTFATACSLGPPRGACPGSLRGAGLPWMSVGTRPCIFCFVFYVRFLSVVAIAHPHEARLLLAVVSGPTRA